MSCRLWRWIRAGDSDLILILIRKQWEYEAEEEAEEREEFYTSLTVAQVYKSVVDPLRQRP